MMLDQPSKFSCKRIVCAGSRLILASASSMDDGMDFDEQLDVRRLSSIYQSGSEDG